MLHSWNQNGWGAPLQKFASHGRSGIVALGLLAGPGFICSAANAQATGQTTDPRSSSGPTVPSDIESPYVLARGCTAGRFDLRFFGGREDLVYTGLAAQLGFGHGWEGVLRGAVADQKSFGLASGSSVRHGGSDIEIAAKYGWMRPNSAGLSALVGVSFPSTPAQRSSRITLGLSGGIPAGKRVALFINPRVAFVEDNTLFGIGLGASVRVSQRISLIGDYTPLLSGDNTRDTITGALMRRNLYAVGLRFTSADQRYSLEVGYGNATGSTTGFSLTPGLGGSGSFNLSISARR